MDDYNLGIAGEVSITRKRAREQDNYSSRISKKPSVYPTPNGVKVSDCEQGSQSVSTVSSQSRTAEEDAFRKITSGHDNAFGIPGSEELDELDELSYGASVPNNISTEQRGTARVTLQKKLPVDATLQGKSPSVPTQNSSKNEQSSPVALSRVQKDKNELFVEELEPVDLIVPGLSVPSAQQETGPKPLIRINLSVSSNKANT
eukprot:TRINITY_DN581_c0_g1_i2.p1 TRINITY_DN581_c0_g1~~TRINITY_DN581_c0_g1_i2.p1  ORF type:complete len:203 (+),score=50.54 TRINITY_DN581_c0_g1_i2:60-668(+)